MFLIGFLRFENYRFVCFLRGLLTKCAVESALALCLTVTFTVTAASAASAALALGLAIRLDQIRRGEGVLGAEGMLLGGKCSLPDLQEGAASVLMNGVLDLSVETG